MNTKLTDIIEAENGGILRHLFETDSLIVNHQNYAILKQIKGLAVNAQARGNRLLAKMQECPQSKSLPILDPYTEMVGCYHDMNIISMIPDVRNELHHRLALYDDLIATTEKEMLKTELQSLRGACFEDWRLVDQLMNLAPSGKVAGYRP